MFRKIKIDPRIRAKHSDLIEQPVVVLVQKFTEDAAKEFREQVEKAHMTGQPVLPIVIDSYGGAVYSLLDMVATLKKVSLPIHTIVTGKAMSCGAMLFGMGQHRHVGENAAIMLHDVSSAAWGKIEEIKSDAAHADYLNNLIFGMVAKNCGQADDYFLKLIHEKGHADWYLTAKEAKKHKLATNIGVPSFDIDISVKYDFA